MESRRGTHSSRLLQVLWIGAIGVLGYILTFLFALGGMGLCGESLLFLVATVILVGLLTWAVIRTTFAGLIRWIGLAVVLAWPVYTTIEMVVAHLARYSFAC